MSHLRAFGHHLPERIITNADLETRTGRGDEQAFGAFVRRIFANGAVETSIEGVTNFPRFGLGLRRCEKSFSFRPSALFRIGENGTKA